MLEDYSCLSDLRLIELSEGSHEAMRELITRYTRLVRACARPLFLAGGDNEDLVQEGMIGLLDAIRSFSSGCGVPFEAFASVCIRRRMISAIRAASARKHAPLNDAVPLEALPVLNGDPESELIGRESFRTFMEGLQGCLSGTERKILDLYLEGFSYREIAQRVGREPKSVDNAVQRIRRKAAHIFGEDGSAV